LAGKASEERGVELVKKVTLDSLAATELHNRLAKEVVAKIVTEPIAAGGTMADVLILCESVLVGVVVECFQVGSDAKILDMIVARAKDRLARTQLGDIEAKGEG
jgi:hypothetical protein